MSVLDNPQYESFAVLVANGEPAVRAYIAAGFKDTPSAVQNASRLLGKDNVRIRVDELRSRVTERAIVKANEGIEIAAISRARVLQRLTQLGMLAEASEQWSPAIRAEELIGKELGMFKDSVQVSGEIDNNVNVRFVE
jgi:hypothetical protein